MMMRASLMTGDKGSYLLLFEATAAHQVVVGALGEMMIRPGYYLYIGSAFGAGGVAARVGRHLRVDKKAHWHVDYVRPFLRPLAVWGSYDRERREHQWAQIVARWPEVQVPLGRFGASDCLCEAHFFWMGKRPLLSDLVQSLPAHHASVWCERVSGGTAE